MLESLRTGALAYAVGGQMPAVQTADPGIQHLIFGAFGLPFGLALIVICGGEAFNSQRVTWCQIVILTILNCLNC